MFGVMTPGEAVWAGGAAVTATVANFLLGLLAARRKANKEDRADALTEWREIAARQDGKIRAMEAKIEALLEAHVECQRENADLRAELTVVRATVEQLKRRAG